jgi:hypothetical protein
MKTVFYILALVCASAMSCSNSANQVVVLLDTPLITNLTTDTTTAYLGVYFENANKGYVVGTKGTIVTTGNGGTDWEKIKLATNQSLIGYYIKNSVHYVCGINYTGTGNDVHSIPQRQLNSPYGDLKNFVSSSEIVMCFGSTYMFNYVGPICLAATNSGERWKAPHDTIRLRGALGKVISITPNIVLAPVEAHDESGFYGIQRLNTQTWIMDTAWMWKDNNNIKGGSIRALSKGGDGTIVGIGTYDGLILVSKDNGNTWNQYAVSGGIPLRDVAMVSSNLGFACGEKGVLLRTQDGGITWSALSSGVTEDLHALYFPTSTVGYVVGNKGTKI